MLNVQARSAGNNSLKQIVWYIHVDLVCARSIYLAQRKSISGEVYLDSEALAICIDIHNGNLRNKPEKNKIVS